MNSFSAFMKQNVISVDNQKVVVSKRMLDDKKKPIEWEIKAILSTEDESLRKACTKKVPVAGKRGQYTQDMDMDSYFAKLAVACCVVPNLNDKELQDSYGVMSGEQLILAMLNAGEYAEFKTKLAEINGFDVSMDDKVDEAKN